MLDLARRELCRLVLDPQLIHPLCKSQIGARPKVGHIGRWINESDLNWTFLSYRERYGWCTHDVLQHFNSAKLVDLFRQPVIATVDIGQRV